MRSIAQGISISQQMERAGGRSSGFDYIRIVLATGVIFTHSFTLSYGYDHITTGPLRVLPNLILPMFFALSGFLVAGSLNRCPTLVSFFGLRILRICPALFAEVMLSAMIFGPLLTSSDLGSYFLSPELHAYFLNIVGDIHYHLPGVFLQNPRPGVVNGQLWTIPSELQCYLVLGGLVVAGIMRKRLLLLAIVCFGQAEWIGQAIQRGHVGAVDGASGPLLILCFLAGVLFFAYRELIPFNRSWFAIAAALSLGLGLLPHGTYYIPLPATYLTVYLGLCNPPRSRTLLSGDYSYGLYLYGFPAQQVIASFGPWAHHWWINFGLGMAIASAVAVCSWHVIERPALGLRRYLPKIEAALVRWASGAGAVAGGPAAGRAAKPIASG